MFESELCTFTLKYRFVPSDIALLGTGVVKVLSVKMFMANEKSPLAVERNKNIFGCE